MIKNKITFSAHIQYPELLQTECRNWSLYYEDDTATVDSILASVWHNWNAHEDNECEIFWNAKCRSMMVGDFVCVNSQWHRCEKQGWSKVTWDHVYGEEARTRKSIDELLK